MNWPLSVQAVLRSITTAPRILEISRLALGHPVDKMLLLGAAAKIGEWQDDDRVGGAVIFRAPQEASSAGDVGNQDHCNSPGLGQGAPSAVAQVNTKTPNTAEFRCA